MCDDFAWAKNPLILRFSGIDENLRVAVVYGENSWIKPKLSDVRLEEAGVRNVERVEFFTIPEARHHVYADQFEEFNEILLKIVKTNGKSTNSESQSKHVNQQKFTSN